MENLLALPVGVVAALAVAALWFLVTPLRDITPAMSLPTFVLLFAGLVVVHELIHALVHPMAGLSPHSTLGFWPSLGFYADYDGEMSRNRWSPACSCLSSSSASFRFLCRLSHRSLLAGSRLFLHSTLFALASTSCWQARHSFKFPPLRLSASTAGGYTGESMTHWPPNALVFSDRAIHTRNHSALN